jgi:flagellar biosynthetic protein FliP
MKFSKALRGALLVVPASLMMLSGSASAQDVASVTSQTLNDGSQQWSLPIQTLVLLTSMTFIPAVILMMTSFTRIIIVLGLLRTAMGTQTTPPNQVLLGIALFLSFFIMTPVLKEIHQEAWIPLNAETITFEQAIDKAAKPLRNFMLGQTRQNDIATFAGIAGVKNIKTPDDVPFSILVPSFVTSELKTAFQIGFTIFIPFLVIDLVVASVLMSLGMMMVPPVTISLPFKLMLFVLVDGWTLIMSSLSASFYIT